MTNILKNIISYKKEEIAARKLKFPVELLKQYSAFNRLTFSAVEFLRDPMKTGIIAEYKKKSPSKGTINDWSSVESVTAGYTKFGASAISVLTDSPSFGGSDEDLQAARFNNLPILRKDFIVDSYQLVESRAIGADVILLIAACLSPDLTRKLSVEAKELGLEILLEIHDEAELGHICEEVDIVGINNRDLKTFTVDIERSIRLAERLPFDKLRIAESGIQDLKTLFHLRSAGFNGFLIGEQFMKTPDPAIAFASFVDQLKKETT